jgi:TolA-binding protein
VKRFVLIIVAAAAIVLGSCGGGGPKSMFETAQFEELQNNQKHAKELYEEIVTKYPDTDYARKSKERLEKLK